MNSWDRSKQSILIYLAILIVLILLTMLLSGARAEEKIIDKEFVTVSSYLLLMTVFDVETTFAAIRNGAHEANPCMKPFAKNRAYMYGVQLGIDALTIWLAYEMKGSKHKELRQTWWIAPSVIGSAHGICGSLNLRYVW